MAGKKVELSRHQQQILTGPTPSYLKRADSFPPASEDPESPIAALPAGLSTSQAAEEYLKIAQAKDKEGDSVGAYQAYRQSLGYQLSLWKAEQDPNLKKAMQTQIEACMRRAEQLKFVFGGPSAGEIKQQREREKTAAKPAPALVDPKLRALIEAEILTARGSGPLFKDVIGLVKAKQALREMVILPALRPDVFSGLRQPPRGLLLYGPPGNGKTLIASAVAAEANATFFNISASSLVSKHFGEGEKLMRALFLIAAERSPSIIFIDELDSILSKRSSEEHEASRRLKTEFMVQFDGVGSKGSDAHIVVIGATNIPDQLDDAVIRRLTKRIFVGTPEPEIRRELLDTLLAKHTENLTEAQKEKVVAATEGYSCSDIRSLCQEASMGPVREMDNRQLVSVSLEKIAPITFAHFTAALRVVAPSVSLEKLKQYAKFESQCSR